MVGIIYVGPIAECVEFSLETLGRVHATCYDVMGVCATRSVRVDSNKVPVTLPKMLFVNDMGAPYTSEYLASRGLDCPFAKELPAYSSKSLT